MGPGAMEIQLGHHIMILQVLAAGVLVVDVAVAAGLLDESSGVEQEGVRLEVADPLAHVASFAQGVEVVVVEVVCTVHCPLAS